jgi:hypothetical protein
MATPYGVPGCRCWPDTDYAAPGDEPRWQPNARCQFHGILPRDRMDTGVYQVIRPEPGAKPTELRPVEELYPWWFEPTPDEVKVCTRPQPHECWVNGPCNGLPKPELEHVEISPANVECTDPDCRWGFTGDADTGMKLWFQHCLDAHRRTTKKERGVLATVRRFGERLYRRWGIRWFYDGV